MLQFTAWLLCRKTGNVIFSYYHIWWRNTFFNNFTKDEKSGTLIILRVIEAFYDPNRQIYVCVFEVEKKILKKILRQSLR